MVTDGTHFTPTSAEVGVPFLTVKDVSDSSLDFENCALISQSDYENAKKGNCAPKRGDVLFSKDGTVGKVHVVATDRPFAVLSSLAILRPDPALVDSAYFGHVLRFPTVLRDALRRKTGSAIRRIVLSDLRQVTIPLPPLPEQRRIAAILDKAGEVRAKRRDSLVTLDALPDSLLAQLRRDYPQGWRNVLLEDAFWFQEGPGIRKWQFRDQGVKLLNVGNIERDGTLNLAKTSRFISSDEVEDRYRHFLVDAGDLVIASSGISFAEDGLLQTRGAFVERHHLPLCMNTSTIRFKAKPEVSTLVFLWVWLGSAEFRTQITRLVTGSAQQNFGPSHLRVTTVSLPSYAAQAQLSIEIDATRRLRQSILTSVAQCDALFTSLQHRAFNGEL
jgi:type I restriction enzyme S subunit